MKSKTKKEKKMGAKNISLEEWESQVDQTSDDADRDYRQIVDRIFGQIDSLTDRISTNIDHDKKKLEELIKVVNDASSDNKKKMQAINNISDAGEIIVPLIKKVIDLLT